MNVKRREQLRRAVNLINSARDIVEIITDEETDSADNMPENLQTGDKYEKMLYAIECLEDTTTHLDNAIENIENALY
ncbi:putative uncharacterized protein [Clostridium sp. CAG:678]|jgi:hypothetical protein|nr:putative uncharacterized protein [Clostridium sp. CAG:678]